MRKLKFLFFVVACAVNFFVGYRVGTASQEEKDLEITRYLLDMPQVKDLSYIRLIRNKENINVTRQLAKADVFAMVKAMPEGLYKNHLLICCGAHQCGDDDILSYHMQNFITEMKARQQSQNNQTKIGK